LWRSDAAKGRFSQITEALIPAWGGATFGYAYTYDDCDVMVTPGYFYKLEAIDNSGACELFGPVYAAVRDVNREKE
jgi:hypothetical protein